jgi:hypothetical protein
LTLDPVVTVHKRDTDHEKNFGQNTLVEQLSNGIWSVVPSANPSAKHNIPYGVRRSLIRTCGQSVPITLAPGGAGRDASGAEHLRNDLAGLGEMSLNHAELSEHMWSGSSRFGDSAGAGRATLPSRSQQSRRTDCGCDLIGIGARPRGSTASHSADDATNLAIAAPHAEEAIRWGFVRLVASSQQLYAAAYCVIALRRI